MHRTPLAIVLGLSVLCVTRATLAEEPPVISGEELFHREWLPNDPRSHGGDGLGPMFNDTSCVACHNQGRPGGGGPLSKNALLLGAATLDEMISDHQGFWRTLESLQISKTANEEAQTKALRQRQRLKQLDPRFEHHRSVVLHLSSVLPEYSSVDPFAQVPEDESLFHVEEIDLHARMHLDMREWPYAPAFWLVRSVSPKIRISIVEQIFLTCDVVLGTRDLLDLVDFAAGLNALFVVERPLSPSHEAAFRSLGMHHSHRQINDVILRKRYGVQLNVTQRNPPALLGAGSIDQIPDAVIEAAARTTHPDWNTVSGRVSRLADGRIGRFGWKGQTGTLYDFTVIACAVELGVHTPDQPQSIVPFRPTYVAPAIDMTREECRALADYLRKLPVPMRRRVDPAEREYLAGGEALFAAVGCAACHLPKLGDVDGLYSDLLLHDMGEELADSGAYGSSLPDPAIVKVDPAIAGSGKPKRIKPATQREWRTPPLWGVRDSSPYLHDGRADTIEESVAIHGGEAEASALRFFDLSHAERLKLVAFLKSLTAQ